MMAFNFNIINLLQQINKEPVLMVLWSSFGMFLCFIVLVVVLKMIQKLGFGNYFGNTFILLSATILFSCVLGSITQTLLLFSEVSGLHMFFIWLAMFATYFIFIVSNKKIITKWLSTLVNANRVAKQ